MRHPPAPAWAVQAQVTSSKYVVEEVQGPALRVHDAAVEGRMAEVAERDPATEWVQELSGYHVHDNTVLRAGRQHGPVRQPSSVSTFHGLVRTISIGKPANAVDCACAVTKLQKVQRFSWAP